MLKNTEKGPSAQDDAERRMMLAEKSGEGVKHQKKLRGHNRKMKTVVCHCINFFYV